MEIHRALKGREVEYVATNGNILVIHCQDGRELQIAWVDDNGRAIPGRPVLRFCGTRVQVNGTAIQRLGTPVN